MKIVELIIAVLMVIVGLGLCAAYASDGKTIFAVWWAALAVVNGATAALNGVTLWVEHS